MDHYPDVGEDQPQPPPPPRTKRKKSSNPLLQAVLLLGIPCAIILLGVPFAMVATSGARAVEAARPHVANMQLRHAISDVMRPYTLAKDSSITPLQAGEALNAIGGPEESSAFAFRSVRKDDIPWHGEELSPDLFRTAQPVGDKSLPASNRIVTIVHAGFNKEERDFLERVAHAPLWHDVNIVGRARGVDLLGARFVLPFPDTLSVLGLPTPRFANIKGIAYAGVSRAAYYLSRNQSDSAEAAIFAVNSLGFAMMDNANNLIEDLIGAVIVGIGRDGLVQLYTATGDPRGARIQQTVDSLRVLVQNGVTKNGPLASSLVEQAVAVVRDSTVPRGLRYEALHELSLAPCANVRALITGGGATMDSAFANATRSLARYPSEVALIQLVRQSPNHPVSAENFRGPRCAAARSGAFVDGPPIAEVAALCTGGGNDALR